MENASSNFFAFGVAILGTGYIAGDMGIALKRANDTVYCAAVGSRSLQKAKAFAAAHEKPGFPAIHAHGSYEEAIRDPLVRAVYVALPTGMKEAIVLQALEANKHVVCEKPFVSAASYERMSSAAESKGLLLMDATHFVHNPRTALILEKIRSGIIGDVEMIQANFFTGAMPPGNIRLDKELEPLGAVGDLAWYTARAAVEYLSLCEVPQLKVEAVLSTNELKGFETLQVAQSLVKFSNGTTLSSGVGFTGAWEQSLIIVGSRGIIKLPDFVLDMHNSGFFEHPEKPLQFHVYEGKNADTPSATFTVGPYGPDFERLRQPRSYMFERLAKDSAAPDDAARTFWRQRSLTTQRIVDTIFNNATAF